jgi:hypothetical protein
MSDSFMTVVTDRRLRELRTIVVGSSILGILGIANICCYFFFGHPVTIRVGQMHFFLGFANYLFPSSSTTIFIDPLFLGIILGPLLWARDGSSRVLMVWLSLIWAVQAALPVLGSPFLFLNGEFAAGVFVLLFWGGLLWYSIWQYRSLRGPAMKALFSKQPAE